MWTSVLVSSARPLRQLAVFWVLTCSVANPPLFVARTLMHTRSGTVATALVSLPENLEDKNIDITVTRKLNMELHPTTGDRK